ncbi:MAG: S41 family peptidase [Intestinimonas sp.]
MVLLHGRRGICPPEGEQKQRLCGSGLHGVLPETEGLLIEAVTEDGPADKAGLKAGDLILEIDGVRMEGEARSRATEYTRGPDGSEAELLIQRADGIEQRFKVVRARVEEHPVSHERLDDGTGVVAIRNFNSRCAEERRRCGGGAGGAGRGAAGI